ncbi:MAG: hypothetical protein IH588_03820 [Anaerolineales bacterium]|nr:hypothetical protein [Anaerolineales bacterium]
MRKTPPKVSQEATVDVSTIGPTSKPPRRSKETGTRAVYFPPAPGYKKNLTTKDYERLTEDFQEDFNAIWKRTPDPWRPTPDFIKTSLNCSDHGPGGLVEDPETAYINFKVKKDIDTDKAARYLAYCGLPDWFINEYCNAVDDALNKNKKRRGGELTGNRVNAFIGKLCDRFYEKYKGDALRTLLRKSFIDEPSQEAAIYVFSKLMDTIAGRGLSRDTIKNHVFYWRVMNKKV